MREHVIELKIRGENEISKTGIRKKMKKMMDDNLDKNN